MITQLIKNIYETQEWPKDFIEVIMTAFKRKPRATTCSNLRAVTHRAKRVVRTLRKISKGNSRMYLEKISLDL